MPILFTLASAAMLAKFLEDEFLKRRGVDLYIDLTDWARELTREDMRIVRFGQFG